MKKAFLIIGILLIVIGGLTLLLAGLFWFAFRATLDGSAEFYKSRFKLALILTIVGIAVLTSGIMFLVFRKRVGG